MHIYLAANAMYHIHVVLHLVILYEQTGTTFACAQHSSLFCLFEIQCTPNLMPQADYFEQV